MTEENLLETPGTPNSTDGDFVPPPLFTNIYVLKDSMPMPKRSSIFSLLSLRLRSDSESSFTDSGIHIPEVVSEAVTDPRSIVKLSSVGNVISGTLEGLVGRLINNISEYFTMVELTGVECYTLDSTSDRGFHDTLLLGCADFTTPETLFGILARRFREAEVDEVDRPQNRVTVQYECVSPFLQGSFSLTRS